MQVDASFPLFPCATSVVLLVKYIFFCLHNREHPASRHTRTLITIPVKPAFGRPYIPPGTILVNSSYTVTKYPPPPCLSGVFPPLQRRLPLHCRLKACYHPPYVSGGTTHNPSVFDGAVALIYTGTPIRGCAPGSTLLNFSFSSSV